MDGVWVEERYFERSKARVSPAGPAPRIAILKGGDCAMTSLLSFVFFPLCYFVVFVFHFQLEVRFKDIS